MAPRKSAEQNASKQTPTEFQKKIIAMTLDEFRARTNIRHLIREEAKVKRSDGIVTDSEVEEFSEYYYVRRHKVHKWHTGALGRIEILPTSSPVANPRPTRVRNPSSYFANGIPIENHIVVIVSDER